MSEPNRQYHQALSANRKLLKENARLKAEVDNLRKNADINTDKSTHEIARLKAEVEMMKASSRGHSTSHLYQRMAEENARLKAEVEELKKPAIIGGYNLSQYIRMANSETLEFDNGDIFADMTLPERIKYIVESHARLKAEVERLTKAGDAMAKVIDADATAWFERVVRDWNAAKEGETK